MFFILVYITIYINQVLKLTLVIKLTQYSYTLLLLLIKRTVDATDDNAQQQGYEFGE